VTTSKAPKYTTHPETAYFWLALDRQHKCRSRRSPTCQENFGHDRKGVFAALLDHESAAQNTCTRHFNRTRPVQMNQNSS
jgi:hypothetical protein